MTAEFIIFLGNVIGKQSQPHTHTHPFNGRFTGTTRVSWHQKGKTNLDFTEARDSEWQWHQLGHMQVCTSLQTDNHASTPPLSFLQAGCPSCRPTNSVKALKANQQSQLTTQNIFNTLNVAHQRQYYAVRLKKLSKNHTEAFRASLSKRLVKITTV